MRLDEGWTLCFPGGSRSRPLAEACFCPRDLSAWWPGILMTQGPASLRVREPRQSKADPCLCDLVSEVIHHVHVCNVLITQATHCSATEWGTYQR